MAARRIGKTELKPQHRSIQVDRFSEACTRCRFLRVDPAQLGRLEEMTANAEARLAEAHDNVWLNEVAALEESLTHLRRRHAEAENREPDRARQLS